MPKTDDNFKKYRWKKWKEVMRAHIHHTCSLFLTEKKTDDDLIIASVPYKYAFHSQFALICHYIFSWSHTSELLPSFSLSLIFNMPPSTNHLLKRNQSKLTTVNADNVENGFTLGSLMDFEILSTLSPTRWLDQMQQKW